MAEKVKVTAESFLKSLEGMHKQCRSCKYFSYNDEGQCRKHSVKRNGTDAKCEDWRYMA